MHLLGKVGFRIHQVSVGADRADLDDPNPPPIPPGYTVRCVGFDDLLPYAGCVPDLSREFLEEAFAFGDESAAAFFGDELVSFFFNKRSRARVSDQLDVLIPAGFRYTYKAWTHPDHRRRNLYNATWYVAERAPQRRYEERSIYYIETHNYASLLGQYQHPNRKAIRFGYVGWFTFLGRTFPFSTRHAKRIGFEFVRKEYPGKHKHVS